MKWEDLRSGDVLMRNSVLIEAYMLCYMSNTTTTVGEHGWLCMVSSTLIVSWHNLEAEVDSSWTVLRA